MNLVFLDFGWIIRAPHGCLLRRKLPLVSTLFEKEGEFVVTVFVEGLVGRAEAGLKRLHVNIVGLFVSLHNLGEGEPLHNLVVMELRRRLPLLVRGHFRHFFT